jgi:hypothetical protein
VTIHSQRRQGAKICNELKQKLSLIMKKILFVLLSTAIIIDVFSQSYENRFENRKKEGYFNLTQISLLMGSRKLSEQNNYYNNNRNSMLVSPSVTMTCGKLFNEHWAAGIGMGFEIFSHHLLPVFLDIRYTLRDNDVSPFFALKTGYAIGNFEKKHYDDLYLDYQPFYVNNADFRNHGGFMLYPEMGVKFPLSEKADLLFSVAYRYQKMRTTVSQDFGQHMKWEHKEDINRLSFGLAIMFR